MGQIKLLPAAHSITADSYLIKLSGTLRKLLIELHTVT